MMICHRRQRWCIRSMMGHCYYYLSFVEVGGWALLMLMASAVPPRMSHVAALVHEAHHMMCIPSIRAGLQLLHYSVEIPW